MTQPIRCSGTIALSLPSTAHVIYLVGRRDSLLQASHEECPASWCVERSHLWAVTNENSALNIADASTENEEPAMFYAFQLMLLLQHSLRTLSVTRYGLSDKVCCLVIDCFPEARAGPNLFEKHHSCVTGPSAGQEHTKYIRWCSCYKF